MNKTVFIDFIDNCIIDTDPPRILSAGPDRLTTAPLYSPAAFECVGEGKCSFQ